MANIQFVDLNGLRTFKTNQDAYNLEHFASLSGGKVTAEQLPSFVDDVIEGYVTKNVETGAITFYSDSEKTQVITGERGKIYVDLAATIDGSYRYSGTNYVEIGTSVSTADKAVNDANGNPIITTYATKDELSTAATTPATKNSLGVVQVGDNIDVAAGVISVATATSDTLGVVMTGANIDNNNGSISVKTGSTLQKGVLSVGTNIDVTDGEISVATGSPDTLGILKVGTNIDVNAGTISVKTGSKADTGILKVGTNLDVVDGTVDVKIATANEKGLVQVGDNISIADGVISVATATDSVIGLAKAGTNVNVDANGTFSVNTATAAQSGVVQIGNNISVDNGTISLTNSNVTGALGYTPVNAAELSAISTSDIEGLFA